MFCSWQPRPFTDEYLFGNMRTFGEGPSPMLVYAVPSEGELDDWVCSLQSDTYGTATSAILISETGPNEVTFVPSTGALIQGDPDASVDEDGVPDLTETGAPNNGDGNIDGIPDTSRRTCPRCPRTAPPPETRRSTSPWPAPRAPPSTTSPPPTRALFPLPRRRGSPCRPGWSGSPSRTSRQDPTRPSSSTRIHRRRHRVRQVRPRHRDLVASARRPGDGATERGRHRRSPTAASVTRTESRTAGSSTPAASPGHPDRRHHPSGSDRHATRAPNANGWYNSNVRVRWTATDAELGCRRRQPAGHHRHRGRRQPGRPVGAGLRPGTHPELRPRAAPGIRIDRTAPAVAVARCDQRCDVHTRGSAHRDLHRHRRAVRPVRLHR